MHANYDKIQTSTRGAQLHTGETKDSINYNIDSTFDYNTNAPNTTKSKPKVDTHWNRPEDGWTCYYSLKNYIVQSRNVCRLKSGVKKQQQG